MKRPSYKIIRRLTRTALENQCVTQYSLMMLQQLVYKIISTVLIYCHVYRKIISHNSSTVAKDSSRFVVSKKYAHAL